MVTASGELGPRAGSREGSDALATSESRGLIVVLALAAGFVGIVLAWVTLLPGLGFWDTGEFQTVGPLLGTAHPTGFPAYVLLGWLASVLLQPFGEPAFRMNLLSALLVGGASALTVVLVRQLTGHLWLALAGGLIFPAIPIVWNIGTHADAHALHIFLVALLLVFLVGWDQRVQASKQAAAAGVGAVAGTGPAAGVGPATRTGLLSAPGDRWLAAAAVTFGVSLANHSLTLLLIPGIGLYVLAVQPAIFRRPRLVAGMTLTILAVALLLYAELPLRAGPFRAPLVYGHPETPSGFLYVVAALQFTGSLYQPFADLVGKLGDLLQRGQDQLGALVVFVPLGFIVTVARQPRYALLTGVSFLITVWFSASYVNADIGRYYLGPALIALSWIAITAAAAVEIVWEVLRIDGDSGGGSHLAARRLGAPSGAALAVELVVAAALLVPTLLALPARAHDQDLTRDTTAAEWAHQAMAEMEPNAVVLSWWSYSTPLWYVQLVEGQRPDVKIIDDRTLLDENLGDLTDVIDANLGKRPVYLVRLPETGQIEELAQTYVLQEIPMPTEQSLQLVVARR